jgi:hypothetical protein
MATRKIFETKCNIVDVSDPKYSDILRHILDAVDVEVKPIKVHGKDAEWLDSDLGADMFSVYLRYSDDFISEGYNPSECIADFSSRAAAESFAKMLFSFINYIDNQIIL